MNSRDLLIEIGTEELPPKALLRLSDAFCDGVREGLAGANLAHGEVEPFATPRRLAVRVRALAEQQPDTASERRGPAVNAAFDEAGEPTKALLGFARSCGVDVAQLERLETEKGSWLVHRAEQPGRPASELIPEIVSAALAKLPIPKRMRWGDRNDEFVRPVHWAVLLFGSEALEASILGTPAGRTTYGHRFHHPRGLELATPNEYEGRLGDEGRVIADFAERRTTIRQQVEAVARELGGSAVIDEALLDEVTGLVEWPVALAGSFDERFLEVPQEALISAMKGHQKYFHVVDGNGRLLPRFITISNIESRQPEEVRRGNERVIRPRLADAEFFWNQDRKRPLRDRIDALKDVVFQKKLGTLEDKTVRVASLAEDIAGVLGSNATWAAEAAYLSKCDLMTEMVGEFPELQGIMGRYYALHEEKEQAIADALDEQYMPRFAGDRLPESPTGQALAIADRIDTLVGIFGIGQIPSGTKDPFALRRAALGVLRTIIEQRLDLDLRALIGRARERFSHHVELDGGVEEAVFAFMTERLRAYYQDQGVAHDTFDAVAALAPPRPLDFDARIRAVTAFRALPEAESLAAANKRIHNILRKAEEEGASIGGTVDPAQLQASEAQQLADAVTRFSGEVEPLFAERRYEEALCRLAALREPVDRFFDEVMVMAEDAVVRANRLALLRQLQGLFEQAADLSRLQGA